jgi:hypothetical protein
LQTRACDLLVSGREGKRDRERKRERERERRKQRKAVLSSSASCLL